MNQDIKYLDENKNLSIVEDTNGYNKAFLRENIESSLTEDVTDSMAALDEQIKKLQHELLATTDIKNSGDDVGMEIRRLIGNL